MTMDLFLKKVYTVAFRLTGEKRVATEISIQAIAHSIKELSEDEVTEYIFQLTIIELMRIFLSVASTHYNYKLKGIERALLELKPLNRAVVIWKDMLGYQIHDNIPLLDCSYEELYKELVCGRKVLKDYFSSNIREVNFG